MHGTLCDGTGHMPRVQAKVLYLDRGLGYMYFPKLSELYI